MNWLQITFLVLVAIALGLLLYSRVIAATYARVTTLIVVGTIMLMPFAWLICSAFKDKEVLQKYTFLPPPGLLTQKTSTGTMPINLDNFRTLFADKQTVQGPVSFWRYVGNSLFLASAGTFISLVFSSMGGYALAKYRFKARPAIVTFMLASVTIPGAVSVPGAVPVPGTAVAVAVPLTVAGAVPLAVAVAVAVIVAVAVVVVGDLVRLGRRPVLTAFGAVAQARARYDDVVPGSLRTLAIRSRRCSSDGAGQGQTRLPLGLLGLAAQPPRRRLLAATTELLRLSQARGHLCPREVFVHEVVHHDLVSNLVCDVQGSAFVEDIDRAFRAGRVTAEVRRLARSCADVRAGASGGSPLLGGTALRPRRPRAHAAPVLRRGRGPARGSPGTAPWRTRRRPATRRTTGPSR